MAKDMSKKCKNCGSAGLLAVVTVSKAIPLADRNGTIKVAGFKIGQMDYKNAWDTITGEENGPEQRIRGPIMCPECESAHFYLVGDADPLRLGDVAQARAMGYDELKTK